MGNISTITRRETLALGAAALTSALTPIADAVESSERHGLSAFGDLKYPADFRQFDYVNANAPKGGCLVRLTFGNESFGSAFNLGYQGPSSAADTHHRSEQWPASGDAGCRAAPERPPRHHT